MTHLTKAVAVIVDKLNVTIYKETGECIVLQQGDPRIPSIIETANKAFKEQDFAMLDLSSPECLLSKDFKEVEASTNGFVRFFSIAKQKLKALFDLEDAQNTEPQVIGVLPVNATMTKQQFLSEVIKDSISSSHPDFLANVTRQKSIAAEHNKPSETGTQTIVAVVNNTVIPNVEKISNQISRANQLGSTVGVSNFFKRLATVERQHTISDLLTFMERADMPIADDGSIIVYKSLLSCGNTYVDCHTRKVKQNVGSYVYMDASLVDMDRTRECSNGLHIARRAYIGTFSGDSCFLCKLAPEDVIAVPYEDPNKMRVSGYHIIFKLDPELRSLVLKDKSITGLAEGEILLAKAISGNHIGVTERVHIKAQRGEDVSISSVSSLEKQDVHATPVPAKTLPESNAVYQVAPVLPEEVADKKKPSVGLKAVQMYDKLMQVKHQPEVAKAAANDMLAYKKMSKKSWNALGLSPEQVDTVLQLAGNT